MGFFTTEATIKSKHFRREQLIRMENSCFWQRSLTAKQLFHGAKGRKTANTHPESAFGWVLIGWACGRSLIHLEPLPLQHWFHYHQFLQMFVAGKGPAFGEEAKHVKIGHVKEKHMKIDQAHFREHSRADCTKPSHSQSPSNFVANFHSQGISAMRKIFSPHEIFHSQNHSYSLANSFATPSSQLFV